MNGKAAIAPPFVFPDRAAVLDADQEDGMSGLGRRTLAVVVLAACAAAAARLVAADGAHQVGEKSGEPCDW